MNEHPDKTQLIDSVLASSKDKDPAIARHINECAECRATVESMGAILQASDNSLIAPPLGVKTRLLSLAKDIENQAYGRSVRIKAALRMLTRPAVIASLLLIAVASLILYNMQKPRLISKEVILTLSSQNGTITYNKEALQKDKAQIHAGLIKTGEASAAVLELSTVFSLKIAENTDISIDAANEIEEKETKKYDMDFEMGNGTILAEWPDHSLKKTFAITTRHGRFEALGTSFLLSSDNYYSTLSVLDGTVRVTAKNGTEHILNKGEGCVAGVASFKKTAIVPQNEIEGFYKLFNKTKYHKIPDPDKPTIENKKTENGNLPQDNEKKNLPADGNEGSREKEKAGAEHGKTKSEFRNETKQMQKEMRNNLRSGKRSQR